MNEANHKTTGAAGTPDIAGMEAVRRIAKSIVFQDSGQALRMRRLLLSLYSALPVALNDVCYLDTELRADLCLVIQGVNLGAFRITSSNTLSAKSPSVAALGL